MSRRPFRASAALAFLALAACGDEVAEVTVDPGFFAQQRFDCDPDTPAPSCPPFACSVDESGRVFDCNDSCGVDNASTVFEFAGPGQSRVCAPPLCVVRGENQAPACEPGCADDGITRYVLGFSCR